MEGENKMRYFMNHCDRYINLQPIYNTRSFFYQCSKLQILVDSTPSNWKTFFKKLFAFERKCGYNYNTYKKRFGITMKILIPQELSFEQYPFVAKKIMDKILNNIKLPYVVFLLKEGKAFYFFVAVSERPFYNKKVEVQKHSSKDVYRNKTTGRICKASDKNAVLYLRKGDFIGIERPVFGNKVKIFKFSSKKEFINFTSNLKKKTADVFVKAGIENKEHVIFKKVNYSKCSLRERANCKKLNKIIEILEKELNSFYKGLLITNSAEEKNVLSIFSSLYRKYFSLFQRMSFRYGKHVIKIKPKSKKFDSIVDLLQRNFFEDMSYMSQKIYGID